MAAAYGVLVYAALPAGVVACNDDFGYLKSVVQTLQHGRPWTNDWLEPWAASLSVLSALLYKATGSFLFATQGLQAIAAALACLGAVALFRARSVSTVGACALALLLLGFPVLFWKTLEYSGMVLYLPCLLWALWAAEQRRWVIFAIVWAVAVASRQSAVTWLALPLVALVVGLRGAEAKAWRAPLFVLVFGGGWVALLLAGMNPTHAQTVRTSSLFWRADLAVAVSGFAASSVIFLLAAGVGRWVVAFAGQSTALAWPKRFGWAFAIAGGLVVALFDARQLVSWDFVMTDRASGFYAKLLVALAVSGWLLGRARLAAPPVALAIASTLVLALRADRYDYYYVDIALAALFCARRREPAAIAAPLSPAFLRFVSLSGVAIGVTMLVYQVRDGYRLTRVLDQAWARCSIYESALRAGRLSPTELVDAPFGYAGWHLHAYAARKGSDTFRRFLDFDRRARSVELLVSEVDGQRSPPVGTDEVLAAQTHRLGWSRHYRFTLRRTASASAAAALGPDYQFVPFPLNDAEWRALIEGPRLKNSERD